MTFKEVVEKSMINIYEVLTGKGVGKLSRTEEEKICTAPFDAVIDLMEKAEDGEAVRTPLGSFKKYHRGSYFMYNPHKEKGIKVPEKTKVKFTISKKFGSFIK